MKENSWNNIDLDDYENHMKLDSVKQLQVMNNIMYDQFYSYNTPNIMILGIAGGNGLNHINADKIEKVYGIDINKDYLDECKKIYPNLDNIFCPLQIDLQDEDAVFPNADIVIANLLIEYIGYDNFKRVIKKVNPTYVSCLIQINQDSTFVSDSPYLDVFKDLDQIHHQMSEEELTQSMQSINYNMIYINESELPNGKKLVRLDYKR